VNTSIYPASPAGIQMPIMVLEHDTRTPSHTKPTTGAGQPEEKELTLNYKGSLPPPCSRETPAGSLLLLEPRSLQVFSSRERVGLAGGGEPQLLSGLSDRDREPRVGALV
jgi:hypothetical protein